jgi:hypothetical protein
LEDPATLAASAGLLRPPRPTPHLADVPEALVRRANEIYVDLCRRAINYEDAERGEWRA